MKTMSCYLLAVLAAASMATACSSPDPDGVQGDGDHRTSQANGAPPTEGRATRMPEAPMPPADEDAGLYTPLEGPACHVESVDHETGASTTRCPGVQGFGLLVQDSDSRMSIDVVGPDGSRTSLQLASLIGRGAFSSLGPRAEWRLADDGAPSALIVRFNVFDQPDHPDRATSHLVVATLGPGKPCAVARIEPGAGQNLRARELADAVGAKACLQAGA